jgi:hypothetical protein
LAIGRAIATTAIVANQVATEQQTALQHEFQHAIKAADAAMTAGPTEF